MDVVRKFSGASGEDLEQWLDRFEVAVDLTGESTQEEKEKTAGRLIPLFLDGAAYSTWKQIPTGRNDLDTVKTALRRVFGKSLATAWRELKELRLLPGQSVDVLAEEAKRLLGIIVGNDSPPQQVVSLALIDALPRTIADQVRMHHGATMELESVVDCAKSLLVGAEQANLFPAAMSSTAHTRARGPEQPVTTEKRTIRCHGCHRTGHVRRECTTECFKCGGRGHLQRECPLNASGNDGARAAAQVRAAPAEEQ